MIFKIKSCHLPIAFHSLIPSSSVNTHYSLKGFLISNFCFFVIADVFGSYDGSLVDERLRKLLI